MTEEHNNKPIQVYDGEIGECIGRVKWFSKPKGFGFITIINDCEHNGTEAFCHFSNIMSDNYKILFPGEFVSCNVTQNNKDGRIGCFNVRGIKGYPLLTDNEESHHRSLPKNNNHQRNVVRDEDPDGGDGDDGDDGGDDPEN